MERNEVIRVVVAGVFTVAALWGLFLIHSPNRVEMTETSVVMGSEAQSSVPQNATVYGQANLTAEEYKLFREKILGKRFVVEDEGFQVSDEEVIQEIRREVTESLYRTSEEAVLLQGMVELSYQADFLQADGYYYPVVTTQEEVSFTLPFTLVGLLGHFVAILLILCVDGVLLLPLEETE